MSARQRRHENAGTSAAKSQPEAPAPHPHRTHLTDTDPELFAHLGDGVLEATFKAHEPVTSLGRLGAVTERTLFGITDDEAKGRELRGRFERQLPGVSFVIIQAAYRSIVEPLVRYVDELAADHPDAVTVVFVPEYVERHWWERILFNETARSIRSALLDRETILVADVPYRRRMEPD